MELKDLKNIPGHYLKDTLKAFLRLEKLKEFSLFRSSHFTQAEKELLDKVQNYRKVEKGALKVWNIVQLSRDERRPQTLDYIKGIFDDFVELKGDRLGQDDQSIITGLARLGTLTVAVVGHNKGRDIKERVKYNFGMSSPSGYRKSQRIMNMAQKFNFPVITFIDTPGAYPAIEAEDQGQATAIAKSIELMFEITVPVITILIGEGGSGGALAMAIGNRVMMLQNSTYSVISPEGCAAILWKDPAGSKLAARALKITAKDLYRLGIIDKVIPEPWGGAQNNMPRTVRIVKKYLGLSLRELLDKKGSQLKKERAEKFESMGFFSEPPNSQ
ncbi:MAG: acetyl-CoA carboxylase carboxyltransferase subunit alpha [Actinomycetota bacterium]|nr:acetyl-CoA carboxylase carboxyltransferase subunit alpha [Actinomycetota bacterium]